MKTHPTLGISTFHSSLIVDVPTGKEKTDSSWRQVFLFILFLFDFSFVWFSRTAYSLVEVHKRCEKIWLWNGSMVGLIFRMPSAKSWWVLCFSRTQNLFYLFLFSLRCVRPSFAFRVVCFSCSSNLWNLLNNKYFKHFFNDFSSFFEKSVTTTLKFNNLWFVYSEVDLWCVILCLLCIPGMLQNFIHLRWTLIKRRILLGCRFCEPGVQLQNVIIWFVPKSLKLTEIGKFSFKNFIFDRHSSSLIQVYVIL